MWKLRIKTKHLPHSVGNPIYATPFASGADLYAAVTKNVIIPPHMWETIPTGICLEIPEGYEAQIRSRSGLAKNKGVFVLNSPVTIDSDYRGEIMVILMNLGHKEFVIKRGDKIAQMVFFPVIKCIFEQSEQLSITDRNQNGFGSTG